MFEATRLLANPWSAPKGEMQAFLLVAASCVSYKKPLCKLDSTVNFRAASRILGVFAAGTQRRVGYGA